MATPMVSGLAASDVEPPSRPHRGQGEAVPVRYRRQARRGQLQQQLGVRPDRRGGGLAVRRCHRHPADQAQLVVPRHLSHPLPQRSLGVPREDPPLRGCRSLLVDLCRPITQLDDCPVITTFLGTGCDVDTRLRCPTELPVLCPISSQLDACPSSLRGCDFEPFDPGRPIEGLRPTEPGSGASKPSLAWARTQVAPAQAARDGSTSTTMGPSTRSDRLAHASPHG